ncbi:hypothetical protein E4U57_002190 [Claviceps arundinis]|uniref:15-hydroxyprostaglandin dehydrogenase n=1 Tax=Claviceps arundinis TaxID=1623583 RepID=A0A9P7MPP7_9HYPO|nr:hypothetical protein E4U56_002768 [Claviceps arundinis]KAG5966542.1 hypothetical protein E4U57_002190 [Claviceps arundinis]
MALDIRGKTALITGGASGIGLQVTHQLLAGGCSVMIADLKSSKELDILIQNANKGLARASFVRTDVTKWQELDALFSQTVQEFGRLDIVIPGAGILEPEGVSSFWHPNQGKDTPEASSFYCLDVNVTHPIRATQLAIDSFQRQKLGHGVVVLISSIAAQIPLPPTPLYAASKHAISGFVRCLTHLEPLMNIRINAVAPGCVNTPLWGKNLHFFKEGVDHWVPQEQVANVIIDLITNKDYVGGTILEVGVDQVRPVGQFNDPGPSGAGHTVHGLADSPDDVVKLINQNFGK